MYFLYLLVDWQFIIQKPFFSPASVALLLSKTINNLSQESRSVNRYSTPQSPEYDGIIVTIIAASIHLFSQCAPILAITAIPENLQIW
jgi:hypothetical protein